MLGMSIFLIFLGVLFFCICVLILLKPGDYFAARRLLTCPETRHAASVKIDVRHRLLTLLRGQEKLRLASCSRWPGRQPCGEECLLQIDLNPELLDRALRLWAEGKPCALCQRPLAEGDWRGGHFSGLDQDGKLVTPAEMQLRDLPMALERYRPVCWPCNLTQCLMRQPILLKGDRRGRREELWDGG
jgi:hypothetical protein